MVYLTSFDKTFPSQPTFFLIHETFDGFSQKMGWGCFLKGGDLRHYLASKGELGGGKMVEFEHKMFINDLLCSSE